jgi:predicted metal-dependent enzyme (double-stranded beta helix superfamily)
VSGSVRSRGQAVSGEAVAGVDLAGHHPGTQGSPVDRFTVAAGEARTLGPQTIHSVGAGNDGYLGAIHVSGGDLFGTPRSTWIDDTERPLDKAALPALFTRLRRHAPTSAAR